MFGSGGLGMGVTFSLVNNASAPAAQAGQSITNLERTVSNASNSIMNAAGRIQSGLIGVTTAVLFLVGPFLSALSASTEFNFQLSRAGAISQSTAAEMSLLKKAAFELGDATMYSATEIAKTEVVLAQAGFFVQQQLEMLPGLTNLATAGVVSLDYAAGIASDTLFQFGLAAKDMGRVSDVIVNAANMSNMSVENFGNAMRYFGPTAKAFRMTLEEAAAYVEMMANSGMRGSIGTRAFGTSLMNLASPTKQAAELMAQIGFDAYTAQGKFVGLDSMVRRLQKSIGGMTDKQRDNAISIIFGNESVQEMLQLLNLEFRAIENGTEVVYRGADALKYFTDKNFQAAGVAEKVSKGMMNNLKSDLKLLSSAFETLQIKMGDIQEGPLRKIVMETRRWVQGVSRLVDTKFGQWLVGIAATVSAVGAGMIVLGFAITVLVPAIWGMVTAVGALMIELAPFIALFAAVVGIILLVKKSIDEFQEVMDGGSKLTGFMGIMQKIGGVMLSVYEIWTTWNGSTYTLSERLHAALQKIGILDFVLELATWIIRIKEFFIGFVEGAVMAYVVVEEVFGYMRASFHDLFVTLEEVGLPMGKLNGALSTFRLLGMAASYVVWVITRPFVFLATIISTVVNSIEWLIVNFKELMRAGMPLSWIQWAYKGISQDKWDNMPGSNFKNTFSDNKKENLPGMGPTGVFSLDHMNNRQSEILSMMGVRSDGIGSDQNPMGPSANEQYIFPIYLDSEKIAEQIEDKQKIKQSRQ